MNKSIGQPVRRTEDQRLLTGRGEFTDDLDIAGQLHAAMVRAPHAHARLRAVDAAAAVRLRGVLAVLTGQDNEVPTATNLLGAKGGGEGGTTPAPAAIVNAAVDALAPFGVCDLEMPLTPYSVWRAISGRTGRAT